MMSLTAADGDNAMGAMVETAIFPQWFHSDQMKHLHYAQSRQGRKKLKVDWVSIDPIHLKPKWAFAIKWSDHYATPIGQASCRGSPNSPNATLTRA